MRQDDLGRDVSLTIPAERVIPLAPNITEQLVFIDASATLVGVGVSDDYPPDVVASLPRINALPLDYEGIVELTPDLVLANAEVNNERDAETLAAVSVPTYFLEYRSLEDIGRTLRSLGELTGRTDTAETAADTLMAQLEKIRSLTSQASHRPTVLFLIGDETLYSYGEGSYVHELIEVAGGKSVTSSFPMAAPVLSEEYVLTEKPDIIIGTFGPDYGASDLLAKHPTWDIVPAVAEDRVYTIDPSLVTRPGPRVLRGVKKMARAIHQDSLALPEAYLPNLP